ncbi:DNA alkylation repair protein [Clostridium uliginosum]|uniref:3-methyladenine DNA glycosylase AlkD n=1 Tax=Clostridium uliginosum TaxID=119641 RepID=A0A1I1IYX8_9CLOT|nr:DNA alkylation repair protein [Clostridium uliginosum]SFC40912.1 3-methyladenine DNA glycosylase AlkD [Clostridium uliginosum]
MTCDEVVSELKSLSSEKYKANVIKMGIPESSSIGVSTGDIRKLAKGIEKSNEFAYELWRTGYHEAKLLAVLVFDKKHISLHSVEQLMNDVCSWDLCDHLCKNLIIKLKGYKELVESWCNSKETYTKRAAFTLMASAVIHEKSISEDIIDNYLKLISEYSNDEREHVKKAVSWALREIGKRDYKYQEKAILLAYELKENGNKSQVWIAKDALKELEKLVRVEGRGRLISSDSKMGKEC